MYASSSDTWFNRPITINSSTLVETEESKAEKDDGVRDKQDNISNNVVYSSLGMFRIQDKGTSVTQNEDGTMTVKIKVKPLASGNYDRIALTKYPAGTADEIKAQLDSLAINADTIEQIEGPNGQTGEITTLYSPEFTFTIDADKVGKKIPFTYSQDGKWKSKAYYLIVLRKEEAAKRVTEIENYKAAEAAIAAAKADPTNKDKVQAALDAIAKLTDAQKADETLAADIKAVNDAKTAIEKKEAKDKTNAEISKIKTSTITLKKAKAGKKKVTVTWKKDANVAGYEISYKVAGAKAKTVKITKNSTTKKVIKKLKKGKKCTVKIRGFKKINNQMVYTKWSKAKKVKIK